MAEIIPRIFQIMAVGGLHAWLLVGLALLPAGSRQRCEFSELSAAS